jgi:succinate dehydrogenase/fumarate reductase flavoprotein subunit
VRELADEIGVNPDQLEETLEQFNSRAEEGSAEPFGRSGKQSLDTPPIYAIKGYPGTWGTWGGPRIDTNAQVQDTNGESVPGLYAAGNASAGVLKFLYPIGGASIGDAFAFGRIAGREAASK